MVKLVSSVLMLLGIGLVALNISGCSPRTDMAPQITLLVSWVRLPPGGRDMTAGYVRIKNTGGADTLVAVTSSVATKIEMHETIESDGMMEMREVQRVPILANKEVLFAPGGYHFMMFGVQKLTLGQQVELTLEFEKSGPKTVMAIVGTRAADQ